MVPAGAFTTTRGSQSYSRPFSANTLEYESARLLNTSLGKNTRKVYASGLREFKGFCKAYRLESIWPTIVGALVQFISHLSLRGCAYKTFKIYLASISFHCKISGMEDTTKSFVVNKLLEGLGRTSVSQDVRKPSNYRCFQ
jgi:hypothetical protein